MAKHNGAHALTFEDVAGSLEKKAAAQEVVTYNDFASELGLGPVNNLFPNHPLKSFFEQIDFDDSEEQRPFRTAVVVQKNSEIPGRGFFDSLEQFRGIKLPEESEAEVWKNEIRELTAYYDPIRLRRSLTITLSHAQNKRLTNLCERGQITPASLVEHTLSHLLLHLEEEFDAIAEADAQIARGEVLTHEEVFARLNERMGLKD